MLRAGDYPTPSLGTWHHTIMFVFVGYQDRLHFRSDSVVNRMAVAMITALSGTVYLWFCHSNQTAVLMNISLPHF